MATVQQNAMASLTSLPHIITDENIHLLRLVKLVTSVGRDLMFWVFTLGCRKNPSQTLKDYLIHALGMTETMYNKTFNKGQRDQILSNPACDQFDVTLLFLAIKLGCDSTMADKDSPVWFTRDPTKLEYLLKQLKDERNELLHTLPIMSKREVEQKIDNLRNDVLVKIVETTSLRYSLDQTERQQRLDQLYSLINQVRDQPLTETEILKYKSILLWAHIERTLKVSGAEELRSGLSKQDIIKPFSFNDGDDTRFTLQSVFSEMIFIQDDNHRKNMHVEHKNILQVATDVSTDKEASLILVRGAAGSGKSTLTRWLIVEWTKQSPAASGIKEYDLVVPLECRSRHIDSFKKLIRFLLPNTCADLNDDSIVRILNLRLLFILDGLDEITSSSRNVVQEILQLCKTRQHTILCTSRPENTREFLMTVPSEYHKKVLEITGIPPKDQAAFVKNYHYQLVHQGKSNQSTEELVRYVKKSSYLQDFFKLPQNLVNLVYLWAFQPDLVCNITSATELYIQFNSMLQNRLSQRLLACYPENDVNLDDLRRRAKNFWTILCSEALVSLGHNDVILQTPSLNRLRTKCEEMELNFRDVTSAFLVRRIVRTDDGSEEQLSFPHKDHHDFCAAYGLLLAITDKEYRTALLQISESSIVTRGNIRQILRTVESGVVLNIQKYQNVLKHLLGLLSLHKEMAKKSVIEEIVELIRESGIASQGQWLDILSEAKCAPEVAEYIAANIFPRKYTRLEIQSAQVGGFAAVMPYLTPHTVILDIVGDPEDLPQLKQLLKEISKKNCRVVFEVWHHYYQPKEAKTTDSYLQCLLHENARCRLRWLTGRVHSVANLPSTLTHLRISLISDAEFKTIIPRLHQLDLNMLYVQVTSGITLAALMPLPNVKNKVGVTNVNLDFPDLSPGEEEHTCVVAKLLQPTNGYLSITFPVAKLDVNSWKKVIEGLHQRGVKLEGGIAIPETSITQEEEQELNLLATATLGASFCMMSFNNVWDESVS